MAAAQSTNSCSGSGDDDGGGRGEDGGCRDWQPSRFVGYPIYAGTGRPRLWRGAAALVVVAVMPVPLLLSLPSLSPLRCRTVADATVAAAAVASAAAVVGTTSAAAVS